jgi:hypothetical protein
MSERRTEPDRFRQFVSKATRLGARVAFWHWHQSAFNTFGRQRQRGERITLMPRINIWIVIAILLALLAVTRYLRDTRICANDPIAAGCAER